MSKNKNVNDWDMMDQLMSNKVDKIITKQYKLEKMLEESIIINKQILKMLNDNRKLYTKKMDETIQTEKKTLTMLTNTTETRQNLEKNLIDNNIKVRIDNHMWRKFVHKDPYSDPSFGVFVKNVLFGSSKIKK
jgi:hypothetical protein